MHSLCTLATLCGPLTSWSLMNILLRLIPLGGTVQKKRKDHLPYLGANKRPSDRKTYSKTAQTNKMHYCNNLLCGSGN